jgi:hypothetical protein
VSNISVDFDVLNQRGSPAWFTDTFANIPTAGFVGRMFISKDTFAFYRDTGSGWDLIGGPGTGTLTGSGVSGQVSFFNGTQTITGNNNLFWDNVNSRLGINTATPGQPLDIHSTGNTLVQLNNTSTGNSNISFQNQDVAKWRVGNVYNAGANSFDIQNAGLLTNALTISSTTNDITITGNLNTGVKVITTGGIFCDTAILLKNLGSVTGTNGYSSFSGNPANNGFTFAPNNSSYHRFITPTTGNYDYTFPATTGTIALTSNLSSYLPLTGGTLTGALNLTYASPFLYLNASTGNANDIIFTINNATFGTLIVSDTFYQFSSNTSGGYLFKNSLGNNVFTIADNGAATLSSTLSINGGTITSAGSFSYTLPSASGTIALTSNITSAISGTTNRLSKFTSANVIGNSMVSDDGTTLTSTGATRSNFYIKAANNTEYSQLAFANGTNATTGGISYNNSGQYMQFETNTSEWMRLGSTGNLLINTTTDSGFGKLQVIGSAYFSSSIGIGTNSFNSNFTLMVSNTTASGSYIGATNLAGGNGDRVLRMGFASAATIATIQGTRIATADDVSIAMQAGGGNVLIGTTSDNGNKLQVSGTASIGKVNSTEDTFTNIGNGVTATLFTMAASTMYLCYVTQGGTSVQVTFTASVAEGSGTAIVGVISTSGATLVVSASGLNIQATNTAGLTITAKTTIIRIK